MDICRVTHAGDPDKNEPDTTQVILTTHQNSPDDMTPMHMVSEKQIAYWVKIEAEYLRLLQQLAEIATSSPDTVSRHAQISRESRHASQRGYLLLLRVDEGK